MKFFKELWRQRQSYASAGAITSPGMPEKVKANGSKDGKPWHVLLYWKPLKN